MCKALTSRFRWRSEREALCLLPKRIAGAANPSHVAWHRYDCPHSFYRDEGADTVIFLAFT